MNLEQREWHRLLAVIEHLNTSLDDQAIRENTGRELLDLLSADHFASYIWNSDEGKFANPVFINMSKDNLSLYDTYYQFHDPITPKLQSYQRAVSVNEIMDQSDLMKTEFFNDFLHKDGLYYGINMYVFDNANENIGDFRVWRSKGRDNFGQRELEILNMIAPHFRNAMRNIAFAKHLPPSLDIEEIKRHLSDKDGLTKREQEVAVAILQGGSDKIISDNLFISMPTLRTHIQHIYTKLDVKSRTEFCSKVLLPNQP